MTQAKLYLFFVLPKQTSNFKISFISYPFFNVLFWSFPFQMHGAHSSFLQKEFTNGEATQAPSFSAPKQK